MGSIMLTPQDLQLVEEVVDDARTKGRKLLRREAAFMKESDREALLELRLRNLRPMVTNALYARILAEALGMDASRDFLEGLCGFLGEHVGHDRTAEEVARGMALGEPYKRPDMDVESALMEIEFQAEKSIVECSDIVETVS